jgi:YVTN family beta-propeller protein
LGTVGVGQQPQGVGINSAARRVYVANRGSDTLSVVDSASYAVVATVAVGDSPNGVAYNPANDRIYVANGGDNSVTVLRAGDHGLVKTIPVGSSPHGVAVNGVTNRVYVVNSGSNTVSIIDGTTNAVARTVAVGPKPQRAAIDPILNKAFVSLYGTDQVAVIDGAGNVTQVSTFSSGGYGIAVDAIRHLVYVATIDSFRIAVVDGLAESFLGWAEVRRASDTVPVPLRLIEVNPLIGTSGHIFVTTAGGDGGWNRFLLLPKGWTEGFARPVALNLNEPRGGLAFEPTTMRVFATSHSDGLLAVYLDGEPSCPANFSTWRNYQLNVCVAGPEGTCSRMIRR